MRQALRILHDEHLTLIGLLQSIQRILAESREKGTQPDFAVLRAVLFHLAHIALEEREILPLAAQVLHERDWDEIEEAMALDPDPLVGTPH